MYRAVSFTTCNVSIYLGTPSPLGLCCRDKETSVQLREKCTVKRKAICNVSIFVMTSSYLQSSPYNLKKGEKSMPHEKATSSMIDISYLRTVEARILLPKRGDKQLYLKWIG